MERNHSSNANQRINRSPEYYEEPGGFKAFWQKTKKRLAVPAEETEAAPEPMETLILTEADPSSAAALAAPADAQLAALEQISRLTLDEKEKRDNASLAQLAAEEAEAARLNAEREVALRLAEDKSVNLHSDSLAAQESALAALDDLANLYQVYHEAGQAAAESKAEEDALRKIAEEEVARIVAENAAACRAAEAKINQLRQELAGFRQQAEDGTAEYRAVAQKLEEAEQVLRKVTAAGEEKLRLALKKAESIRQQARHVESEAEATFEVLAAKLNSVQQAYDKTAASLSATETAKAEIERSITQIKEDDQALRLKTAELLHNTHFENSQKIQELELASRELLQEAEGKRQQAEAARQQADVLDEQRRVAADEAKRLRNERDETAANAEAEIQRIMLRIEDAKHDVGDKKDMYVAAQKSVEKTTAQSVRANAVAKGAKERANRAATEREDARTAADMASRLRADASMARQNSDDSSSQLLNKAEMVLLNTVERAERLLEDKTALCQASEREAERLSAEAVMAATAAEKATAIANDMIAVWLAAEESLVKITVEVEAERQLIEARAQNVLEQYALNLAKAEDAAARCREQAELAIAEADRLGQIWEESEGRRRATEERLQQLLAEDQAFRQQTEQRLERELADYAAQLAANEVELQRLREESETLYAADRESARMLAEKMAEYEQEREKTAALVYVKQNEVAAVESELEAVEQEVAAADEEARQSLSKARAAAERWQEALSAATAAVAANESALAEAEKSLLHLQKEGEVSKQAAEETAARAIAPKEEARRRAEEKSQELAATLLEKQLIAEQAMQLAAEVSARHIAAANEVSLKLIDKDIESLRDKLEGLRREANALTSVLASAETTSYDEEDEAERLRQEEEKARQSLDERYAHLQAEKETFLSAVTEKLDRQQEQWQTAAAEQETAEQQLTQARERRLAAEQALTLAIDQAEQTRINSAAELQRLQEAYQEKLRQASIDMPALEAASEAARTEAEAAKAILDDKESAYLRHTSAAQEQHQQALTVIEAAQAEAVRIKAEGEELIQTARARLQQLKDKETELQEAFQNRNHYAVKAGIANTNAQERLQQLREEEVAERNQAEEEIAALKQTLESLREEAESRHQKYLATEKTMSNSKELKAGADQAFKDAEQQLVEAGKELASAQATKETAMNLAHEAALAHQTVDKDTAAIMKRAAEGLLAAADNAAAMVKEKEQLQREAQEELERAEINLAAIQRAIDEAPQLLAESKQLWQAAETEYEEFSNHADASISKIRQRLNDFLAERQQEYAVAEENAERCQQDAERGQREADSMQQQLLTIGEEIEAALTEVQQVEEQCAARLAEAEAAAAQLIAEAESKRAEIDAETGRLEEALLEAQQEEERAAAYYAEKAEQFNHYRDGYLLIDGAESAEFNVAKEQVAADQAAAEAAVKAGEEELRAAEAALTAAEAAQASCREHLAKLAALREQLEQERDQAQAEKERLLQAAAEEKLRLVGSKTIARINAEEKAAQAAIECWKKRSKADAINNRMRELESALLSAEQKRRDICAEHEKALQIYGGDAQTAVS